MDYANTISNLQENLRQFESLGVLTSEKSYVDQFIIHSSKYDVSYFDDSIYIKKGDNPKAVLHLNIDSNIKDSQISLSEDGLYLYSSNDLNYVNSLLAINELLQKSSNDFDVLITKNNIQKENRDYKALYFPLRSKNIINLNLRQSRCLANEFSSLILSKINIPVERFYPDYDYKIFRISLSNLIGGHSGSDLDKVRINSIKSLVTFIRKMKAKVDLNIINLQAGDRYDRIPSFGHIDFVIKSDFVSDLEDIFDLIKNEYMEKNLKHEPNMDFTMEEINLSEFNPITQVSFEHLSSFIELVPSGAYAVDNLNNELISSINLSISRTSEEFFNFIIVYRSLTSESMKEMLKTTKMAAKISSANIESGLIIPRWKNSKDNLTEVFKQAFNDLTGEELDVAKTQYSLDSSIIFNNLDVNLISLGVEYKQGESGNYFSPLEDIADVIKLVDTALTHLAKL